MLLLEKVVVEEEFFLVEDLDVGLSPIGFIEEKKRNKLSFGTFYLHLMFTITPSFFFIF